MCKICVKAEKLLIKNLGKEVASGWLMNYTGFPFWSAENTLKEVKLFLALTNNEQQKRMKEIDDDIEKVIPLYKGSVLPKAL